MKVTGLILGGSADLKTEPSQSDTFGETLQSKDLKLVDGNQATELSVDVLSKVKSIQTEKLIQHFGEISQDTDKYCFGAEDTLKALAVGAVEILTVYENLDIMRNVLHCQGTEEEKILNLTEE